MDYKLNLSIIKRFFEPAIALKWANIKGIIRTIMVTLNGPINALFIGIIGSILETGSPDDVMKYIMLYIVIVVLIHLFLEFSKTWGRPETYYQQMRYIQNLYLPKFLEIEGTYIDKLGTGKLIAIMSKGFDKWTSLINDTIYAVIILLIGFLSGFYFSSKLGWVFVVSYFVLFVSISFVAVYLDEGSIKYRNKRRDALNDYSRFLVRFIMSRVDIIQNNKIDLEVNETGKHLDEAARYTIKQSVSLSRMFNIPRIFINIFRVLILIYGSKWYFEGLIGLGDFSALLGFMLLVDNLVSDFIRNYKNITKDLNEVQKLREIFDSAPKGRHISSGKPFTFSSGNFVISDLTFTYDIQEFVFKNFNLTIDGGTKTAFVGESGGGKSTLIKLLAGYIRPTQGDIFIDGQVLSSVKLVDYYKHIGYLTQDPSVFDGSIYDNLIYALQSNPSDDQINTIIKLAKCEFIWDFNKGLYTEIGERGIRLSGGQKQRLAIAKIMLKNPDIIFLDEPTSALDSFNEEQINIALDNLFKGKTVFIVAHRLQTVKQADRILLFDKGVIVEDGTHKQLLAKGGFYKRMLDLQSGF